MCLISTSFGATVWVSDSTTSWRLLRRSTVMSTVSRGMGTRNTFSNDFTLFFASSYDCHSWNSVENELR